MTMTFTQLLKSQSNTNLIDIYNETLYALEDQKKYHDSPMALEHFTNRVQVIRKEMIKRGLWK